MSVSSTTSSVTYAGNASTSAAYPVPFQFIDATDLVVVVNTAGVPTTLVLGTGYTASGGAGSTGSIVTTSAIPATSSVIISRNTAKTQLTSYTTGDRFPAATHEKALDKLTMLVQEATATAAPPTSTASGAAPYVLGLGATGGTPTWTSQTAAAIADGAITSVKIAAGAVTPAKLSTGGPSWDTSGSVYAVGANPAISVQPNAINGQSSVNVFGTGSTLSNLKAFQMYCNQSNAGFYSNDSIPFYFTNAATPRMIIAADGNVGIGTSSPNGKLEVVGASNTFRPSTTSEACSVIAGASDFWSVPTYTGVVLRQYGSTATGTAYNGVPNAQSGQLIFQNTSTGVITTNGAQLSIGTVAVERIRIGTDGVINTQGNPITNCPTTAKAWVNFNGATVANDYTTGNTITYVAGASTTTVTITRASHVVTVGNWITVSGVTGATGVNGTYQVTAVTATTIVYVVPSVVTGTVAGTAVVRVATIRSSYNVSSITKNGTGDYTVNFATPMADANYAMSGAVQPVAGSGGQCVMLKESTTPATTSVNVVVRQGNLTTNTDAPYVCVQVFGN